MSSKKIMAQTEKSGGFHPMEEALKNPLYMEAHEAFQAKLAANSHEDEILPDQSADTSSHVSAKTSNLAKRRKKEWFHQKGKTDLFKRLFWFSKKAMELPEHKMVLSNPVMGEREKDQSKARAHYFRGLDSAKSKKEALESVMSKEDLQVRKCFVGRVNTTEDGIPSKEEFDEQASRENTVSNVAIAALGLVEEIPFGVLKEMVKEDDSLYDTLEVVHRDLAMHLLNVIREDDQLITDFFDQLLND